MIPLYQRLAELVGASLADRWMSILARRRKQSQAAISPVDQPRRTPQSRRIPSSSPNDIYREGQTNVRPK